MSLQHRQPLSCGADGVQNDSIQRQQSPMMTGGAMDVPLV
jgi:hypothetical protein